MKLWIRIDVAIRSDPNVAELAARLGITLAEAVGLCTLVWAAIAEHRPNGDLSGIAISAFEKWASWEPRKGKPAGAFGRAFTALFVSDESASGWTRRQGKLVEGAERDRLRKSEERRRKSADNPGLSTATERNGTERDGTGRNREHLKSVADKEISKAPAVRERFLEIFYRTAQPERQAEVEQQLTAALSPGGVRVRKGEFVKARSVRHLDRCLADVIAHPPDKPDAAIVWVIRKLSDPELNDRGQTVTEAASDNHKRDEKLFDIYHAEKTEAGRAWATENPDDWATLEARIDRALPPSDKPMYATIRRTQMANAAGDAAGFPAFDDWLSNREVHA